MPKWVTSLAGACAGFRNSAKTIQDFAIHGMRALVEVWQAPPDICHRKPRKKTAKDHVVLNESPRRAVEIRDAGALGEEQFGEFSLNEWIEVFSNTCQVWCDGQIKSIINNNDFVEKIAIVAFQSPDAGSEEISYKILPLGCEEMRKAKPKPQHGGC